MSKNIDQEIWSLIEGMAIGALRAALPDDLVPVLASIAKIYRFLVLEVDSETYREPLRIAGLLDHEEGEDSDICGVLGVGIGEEMKEWIFALDGSESPNNQRVKSWVNNVMVDAKKEAKDNGMTLYEYLWAVHGEALEDALSSDSDV